MGDTTHCLALRSFPRPPLHRLDCDIFSTLKASLKYGCAGRYAYYTSFPGIVRRSDAFASTITPPASYRLVPMRPPP